MRCVNRSRKAPGWVTVTNMWVFQQWKRISLLTVGIEGRSRLEIEHRNLFHTGQDHPLERMLHCSTKRKRENVAINIW